MAVSRNAFKLPRFKRELTRNWGNEFVEIFAESRGVGDEIMVSDGLSY